LAVDRSGDVKNRELRNREQGKREQGNSGAEGRDGFGIIAEL
jgi:hypothetical protein